MVWNSYRRCWWFALCLVANYITKLRGLKLYTIIRISPAPIIVANYITKLRGLKLRAPLLYKSPQGVANYITKLRGLKPQYAQAGTTALKSQIISQNYVVWNSIISWKLDIKLLVSQIISQNYVVWNSIISWKLDIKLLVSQIISQNYVVWNKIVKLSSPSEALLQIISQNYVVWNQAVLTIKLPQSQCCKLYHKTTWFETLIKFSHHKDDLVANYITKLRGLKPRAFTARATTTRLQIISQNYVVWNTIIASLIWALKGCKLYHKTTWFETCLKYDLLSFRCKLQIISQNYVVWNHFYPDTDIVFFCGCKLYHKTTWFETLKTSLIALMQVGCKLYHKTTWFETRWWRKRYICAGLVANYITKLRGLKPLNNILNKALTKVANYITKLRGLKPNSRDTSNFNDRVANYITKLRGLKPLENGLIAMIDKLQIISQNYVVWSALTAFT